MSLKPYRYHMLVDPAKEAAARLAAVLEVDAGATKASVGRRYGVSRQTIDYWCGIADAATREVVFPPDGTPPKLSLDKLRTIAPLLDKGPRACGFDADSWTLSRVRDLIARELKVGYHANYVSKILHRMGYSPQKPERRASERDEQAIETWKREVLPALEKKSGRGSHARGS